MPVHAVSSGPGSASTPFGAGLGGGHGSPRGPVGVGKSTLVNELLGEDLLATGDVRDDGSGRHTTTRRELVALPVAGSWWTTPACASSTCGSPMRGSRGAFEDVVELAAQCRFSDCRHEGEPGCAIEAALADGRLARERWDGYRDLQRELAELEAKLERRERLAPARRPGGGS